MSPGTPELGEALGAAKRRAPAAVDVRAAAPLALAVDAFLVLAGELADGADAQAHTPVARRRRGLGGGNRSATQSSCEGTLGRARLRLSRTW